MTCECVCPEGKYHCEITSWATVEQDNVKIGVNESRRQSFKVLFRYCKHVGYGSWIIWSAV